jgi:hypothetical protein
MQNDREILQKSFRQSRAMFILSSENFLQAYKESTVLETVYELRKPGIEINLNQ